MYDLLGNNENQNKEATNENQNLNENENENLIIQKENPKAFSQKEKERVEDEEGEDNYIYTPVIPEIKLKNSPTNLNSNGNKIDLDFQPAEIIKTINFPKNFYKENEKENEKENDKENENQNNKNENDKNLINLDSINKLKNKNSNLKKKLNTNIITNNFPSPQDKEQKLNKDNDNYKDQGQDLIEDLIKIPFHLHINEKPINEKDSTKKYDRFHTYFPIKNVHEDINDNFNNDINQNKKNDEIIENGSKNIIELGNLSVKGNEIENEIPIFINKKKEGENLMTYRQNLEALQKYENMNKNSSLKEKKEEEDLRKSSKFFAFTNILEKFVDSNYFVIFFMILTVFIMFINDIQIGFLPKSVDYVIDILLTITFALFFFEIILNCIVIKEYFNSFFFWLDVISTLSILQDIGFIINPLLNMGIE
jgi:hypothetical protein